MRTTSNALASGIIVAWAFVLLVACQSPPTTAPQCSLALPPCEAGAADDAGPCATVPPAVTSRVTGRALHDRSVAAYARTVPPAELGAWQARAALLRAGLWTELGLPAERPVPGAQTGEPRVFDDVIIVDVLIDGFEGMQVPATLYLPRGFTAPVPAVLVNIGHEGGGQSVEYVRAVCWRLATHGIAAMSTDWLGTGSRMATDQRHVPMGLRSYLVGLLPQQPLFGEPLLAFEYLRARPEVDPARVGMVGQSGGGVVTMYLAAMDPRVAAVSVIDIVAPNPYIFSGEGWGDPDSFLPGFHAGSSHGELLAMIAPRPLQVLSGDDDPFAPTAAAEAELGLARAAYELLGAPERFETQGFPTDHCFCETKITATVDFFGRTFLDLPISERTFAPPGTEPRAMPASGTPRWPDLLPGRLAIPPVPPPFTAPMVDVWRSELQGDLITLIAPEARPTLEFTAQIDAPARGCGLAVLWISDTGADPPASLDRPGLWTIELRTPALRLTGSRAEQRNFHAQEAIMLGRSLLSYAVEDLAWAAAGARENGALRVVAVCDGPQASLACVAAGALPGALDALVVRGLPADFHALLPIGQPDPFGVYVTPGLGALASPDMLLAQIAPRPLAIVDATAATFSFTEAIYDALQAHGELDYGRGDLSAATAWAVDRLGVLE